MKSKIRRLLLASLSALALAACFEKEKPLVQAPELPDLPTLIVFTYDSMIAQGGLGPQIERGFEKFCHCDLVMVAAGDAGQIATRLDLDHQRGKVQTQVILGIDQNLWPRVKSKVETFKKWKPKDLDQIDPRFLIDSGFMPFDYGVFTFMVDTKKTAPNQMLASFSDLTKAAWTKKILLQNPQTSTPGLGFLLFSQKVLGGDAKKLFEFWNQMRGQWLTLTAGWDEAYGVFLKEEAPYVWSYTTSQAYHRMNGDEEKRYQAIVFKEGNPYQVEGAAIVKAGITNPEQHALARRFLEYLISAEVQEMVPTGNWMLPVRRGVTLPQEFLELPQPKAWISLESSQEQTKKLTGEWEKWIRGIPSK